MGKWERLLDLYDEIEDDPYWDHLRTEGIRLVRGDGAASVQRARVMVVGEAPGAQENGQGRPFVGRSGAILDGLLALAGFHRRHVFITNVVKYRPPGNRTPALAEQLHAQEELRREWAILKPALTIAVGSVAHAALGRSWMSLTMTRRGELHYFGKQLDGQQRRWITSQFHPAYGLRNKSLQPRMEEEWGTLWEMCKEVGGILCPVCFGRSAREEEPCALCEEE